ncbi:MAG: outer membrane lipoprotein-sorting protein [Tannerella sp.]|jgi:outer membrane lipoprotein-sorting protein|nr:outer membrane lipoprotein-sorting protein [Tannerella sp.]
MKLILLFILLSGTCASAFSQTPDATEIIRKVDENNRGAHVYSEIKMTVVRPTWKREIGIKSWARGSNYTLAVITSPAKEKGQAFLKRQKDLWNWVPSISRMIKMSSSVMGQSWMGSDFTNDDLMRESSTVNDYTHELAAASEKIRDTDCYKIVLTPKEDAAIVWGKVVMWVSKADFIDLKTEFYDEDGALVNTINSFDIKQFGKRRLSSKMEVVPADKPNQKTVMEIIKYDFDTPIEESFFSQQNMKTVK